VPLAMLSDHTFMPQFLSSDSVVLDLGANHGDFSHSIIAKYGCRSFAVEANPSLCATMCPDPRLTVVNAAVAATTGTLAFYVHKSDDSSSLLRFADTDVVDELSVPALSLVDLLARLGSPRIDLLKVDIEGAEVEMFGSCPDELLKSMPQITVEFHDFNKVIPKVEAERIVHRLESLGFETIKMWMQSYGDTLFVNRDLTRVHAFDLFWSRRVVRNWWWTQRFVKRQVGLSK
jgi:FkbM family methyltransferase